MAEDVNNIIKESIDSVLLNQGYEHQKVRRTSKTQHWQPSSYVHGETEECILMLFHLCACAPTRRAVECETPRRVGGAAGGAVDLASSGELHEAAHRAEQALQVRRCVRPCRSANPATSAVVLASLNPPSWPTHWLTLPRH